MTKKGIRDYLYQAIALPLTKLLIALSLPFYGLFSLTQLVWKTKSINKVLKYVIAAPLLVLSLLSGIPTLVLYALISTLLTVTKITLFPEFFFSLWIKEGVQLSKVLSLSATHFSSKGLYEGLENFPEIKNQNRELLVELLSSDNLNIQKATSLHKDYSEFIKNFKTEIYDQEKSKIIFDYLGLNNVKPLIEKDMNGQYCLHNIYQTCKNGIKIINNIDIGLFKEFLKLDEYSAFNSSINTRATKLSNIIYLFDKHYLAYRLLFTDSGDVYAINPSNINLFQRHSLAKDISDAFSSNTQSSLIKIIQYFLPKNMDEQDLSFLILMLKDKNVVENLKRIDNINNTLPGTLEFESPHSFLSLRGISYNRITHFFINDLYSLLLNNRLFDKLDSIPTKVLKDICSTELCGTCKTRDEVLAFFDCLDDNERNKNILDNLKTAFETDSEATHALLNNKLFYYQGEILEVIKDKKFDGNKVREVLNKTNLVWILKTNGFIDVDARWKKVFCVFSLRYIIQLFRKQIKTYLSLNEIHNDQQAREIFLNNVDLFCFLLKDAEGSKYEKVLSIIKDTKFEDLKDDRFIVQVVGHNLKDYLSHLLIFHGALFSDISNEFRLHVIHTLFPLFKLERGPLSTIEACCKETFKMKFIELFIKQKYEKITQESLEKIQDLTIEDILKIPGIEEFIKMEEIEKFLNTKGITNQSDLSLLAELIKNSIHVADEINNKLHSEKSTIQTICDVFQADPYLRPVYLIDLYAINIIKSSLERKPPSLLDLCKTSIIRSSLDQQSISQLL